MSKTLTLRSAGFSRRIDLATLWRLSLALLATALVMLGALSWANSSCRR